MDVKYDIAGPIYKFLATNMSRTLDGLADFPAAYSRWGERPLQRTIRLGL